MVKKKDEPVEEQANEGQEDESEATLEQLLSNELHSMDKQLAGLDIQKKDLETAVKKVTDIIYAKIEIATDGTITPPGEFADSANFRNCLDGLYEYLGQALDYVVRLEKQRGMVFQEEQQQQMEGEPKTVNPSPVNVNFNSSPPSTPTIPNNEQQPQKFGFWAWRALTAQMKFNERVAEQQATVQQPVVATSKIVDVVEFGRQLQPAFNKIKTWLAGTLAHVRHYQDKHIYIVFHEELATYFGQTIGALITFVNARIEYRRSLIEGRKLALVRSMARIAEARSMAPQVQVGGTFAQKGFKLSKDGFSERE